MKKMNRKKRRIGKKAKRRAENASVIERSGGEEEKRWNDQIAGE